MIESETMDAIAISLQSVGVNAAVWNTGGDTLCIAVFGIGEDVPFVVFGTAAGTWAGELLDAEGNGIGSCVLDVSSDSEDAPEIAADIVHAIATMLDEPGS